MKLSIYLALGSLAMATATPGLRQEENFDKQHQRKLDVDVDVIAQLAQKMEEENNSLESEGSELQMFSIKLYSDGLLPTGEIVSSAAHEVIAKDVGDKFFDLQLARGDSWRGFWNSSPHDTLNYAVLPDMYSMGHDPAEINDAIDAAMAEWESVECFQMAISKNGSPTTWPAADVMHKGFDWGLADSNIIAYEVEWWWGPFDRNNDGFFDKAFGEIYYNPIHPKTFSFNRDPGTLDLQTVALHESGHALGIAHFGTVRQNFMTGKITATPRAVMNAVYIGPIQELSGTDKAGICEVYDDEWMQSSIWPN